MRKACGPLFVVLAVSGIYLYAYPAANLFYIGTALAHAALGVLGAVCLAAYFYTHWKSLASADGVGWALLALGAILGLILIKTGTPRPLRPLLFAHIAASTLGGLLLVNSWISRRRWLSALPAAPVVRALILVLAVTGIGFASRYSREALWRQRFHIKNPELAPAEMAGEGDGPSGHFFPSSIQTTDGKKIPAKFFMESQACERCHSDIYKQWNSSAHRLSSFNNQWYRKSIEYMQEVSGVQPSKWCGGCHDPAVLMSGMMDTPIKQIVNTPEAHAGMGCMMCHSMVHVKSTMGQADFVLEYPKLHELAASENPVMRELHDFMIKLNPEPHRRAFLKPLHNTAEFCSSCHKVHLDVPVNSYRWIRGFNDYDNWQASGISGQGARSFYYPPKPQQCLDCHMPLTPSKDFGSHAGLVHSHRFPAANTALPFVNDDAAQMKAVTDFLTDNVVSVDIFALSEAQPKEASGGGPTHDMATTFAVGEEAELNTPNVGPQEEVAPVAAPLGKVEGVVRRGDDVRLDVVVRTRKVGHFFPGGTVDAFDVWVELQAADDKGQILYWNGWVEDDGKGPVDKGAHFYRSRMIDANGNVINKRNAWSTRALVYVKLIPPGAADTVRYRLAIPKNAGGKITVRAKLHYRKFDWFNTQFSYAGERDPSKPQEHTPHYDNGTFVFTGDTSKVSGKLKAIPVLPIITMAQDEKTLRVLPASAPKPTLASAAQEADWERWNDYGIGLLLQGDLRGAEFAFRKVAEAAPGRADGWVNMGRVHVQEGDTVRAKQVLEKALAVSPKLASAHFFYARALRSDGDYDPAIQHLNLALEQYPRDRVVRNELGRVYFLKRQYARAIEEFRKTLEIDPEDLQAHYNLMLSYNGAGDAARAEAHRKLYMRFKADESSQALTGRYRQQNPDDNRERQAIHEHESTWGLPKPATSRANKRAQLQNTHAGVSD